MGSQEIRRIPVIPAIARIVRLGQPDERLESASPFHAGVHGREVYNARRPPYPEAP